MKLELEFIPVKEKLPIDDWRKNPWWNEELKTKTFDDFFAIVDNDDPADDPDVCIVTYLPDDGFVYRFDTKTKYDGDPWRVTHWANIPNIKPNNI